MKTIKLAITNPYKKPVVFNLFEDGNKPALPVNAYTQTSNSWEALEYKKLVDQITIDPLIVNVQKSTNNRQLNFYNITMWGMKPGMEPSLTIDKKPRLTKKLNQYFTNDRDLILCMTESMPYKTQWNPKKWNIADTQEHFLLTHNTTCIEATILPAQRFEIYFEVSERIKATPGFVPTAV